MEFKKRALIAFCLSFVYFIVHLLIINDYGLSWDFHYHFYGGLYHLGLSIPSINDPSPVPFSSPDPRLTIADPFGPFTQIIPTLSYLFFFKKLKILPFDSAYNLAAVFFGSAGIGVMFFFLSEAINTQVAVIGAIFLALLPVHFGYLHNNMKDVPSAFAFALAIFLFWRLVKNKKMKDLLAAVLAFAFAFNVKINSILIPAVCFSFFVLRNYKDLKQIVGGNLRIFYQKRIHLILLYFLLAPLAALFLWWPFWQDPIAKLMELPSFYSRNTLNMPVFFFGKNIYSGVNIPWYYPYVYIAITAPLPILFFFIVGLFLCFKNTLKKESEIYLLLLLWFFIPLLRYFVPKSGAIDGVRHFMEIIYPLCGIAAFGGRELYIWWVKKSRKKTVGIIVSLLVVISFVKNIIEFHPYQTSYYNQLIGGINGAYGRFDIDFWGSPQKEAMEWLNKNAPLNSRVHVVMAQSSAGVYLRPDLLKYLNQKNYWESDYSVVLNKQSFFSIYKISDYIKEKIKENKIAYQRSINNVPLVWIFEK